MEETGRNGEEMERTLVWGHRGASGYAPENTMAAFEKAVELGADGIEVDVQLTKDGELVVIHDETIDRVSDGSGWVKDYTYAKLIKHNFNRTHPEYEHAQIPTLEETLMRKKNLERIKIPVLIFIAGNDHTSKAGVIVIASMFVIGFVIFKIQSQTMQRREKRSLAVSRTRDEFEAETENDYDDYEKLDRLIIAFRCCPHNIIRHIAAGIFHNAGHDPDRRHLSTYLYCHSTHPDPVCPTILFDHTFDPAV